MNLNAAPGPHSADRQPFPEAEFNRSPNSPIAPHCRALPMCWQSVVFSPTVDKDRTSALSCPRDRRSLARLIWPTGSPSSVKKRKCQPISPEISAVWRRGCQGTHGPVIRGAECLQIGITGWPILGPLPSSLPPPPDPMDRPTQSDIPRTCSTPLASFPSNPVTTL